MLPANAYDSPHRRQRFIELHNVGSETIPGYAVVEVIESSRPESGGTVTPGGGRTVLHVRLAESDDPCVTAINGPCEIPADGWGRPGTLDDPMLALVKEEYDNGTDVGVEEGSFLLTEGHCGYRIVGDFDATTQTQRVIRTDDCQDSMMVRATECILPGQGGEVQPQQWNSELECWEDSDDAPFDIIDPMGWLLAVPNDCFKIDRQSRCGTSGRSKFMPSFPFGMTQLVRVKELIECGDCGEVTVVRKELASGSSGGHCDTEETECKFQACNMTYRPISCDAEEYAMATIIPGQCCLPTGSGSGSVECIAFLFPFPRPVFAKGQLSQNLCEGDGQITGGQILDACTKSDFAPPTTAGNSAGMHACANTPVLMLWKVTTGEEESCGWEIIAVADQELPDYMLDIQCKDGACDVEYKYKVEKRYGHFCKCGTDPEDWADTSLTFDEIEIPMGVSIETASGDISVLTDAECGTDCSIVFASNGIGNTSVSLTTKKICVPCQKASLEDGEDIPLGEFATIGASGAAVTLTGKPIDVITETKVEYDAGSGGSGEGCPPGSGSEGATIAITVTGKTKRICTFCSELDEAGDFIAGDDIDLFDGLEFGKVEALSDSIFDCTACPTLTNKTKMFWALCVDPSETVWQTQECICIDCDTGSGSGA
jgi:hypothetical protein